ncbi:MAG: hypothetical protein ABSD03_14840 [Vulcanimicrobiaceae bacterium]|jgi:hypothetical protein
MSTSLANPEDDDGAITARPANSFGAPPAVRAAAVEAESQRAIAEVQAALTIGQRFPRNQVTAMDRILVACSRQGLAEKATYSYARGGTEITGPTIRLAEALAQQWGNIKFGIRELEQRPATSQRPGESTVEAFAWDVETNTLSTVTFQVPHVRHTRSGQTRLTDPRDIYEVVANNGARRLRARILAVIPGDVVEDAVRQCETTLATKLKITPERIESMVASFAVVGVAKKALEARIQRHVDKITPAQMVSLGKILNSINDGMSAPADWFEIEPAADGAKPAAQSVKDRLEAKLNAGAPAGEPAATQPAQPSGDGETDEAAEAEAKLLATMSGPDLTKFLKAEAKRLKIGNEELDAVINDHGGWASAKANSVAILETLRRRASQ